MNKAKKAALAVLACTMVLGVGSAAFAGCSSCKPNKKTVHDDIVNGGFEEGDFTGWEASGDYAFDADGVVEEATVDGIGITVDGKVGKYYFNGLASANATATGTLTSEPFTLGGTGKIGFKIGAGSDASKCYVEFIENGTDTVLKKVSNEAYDAGFIDDDLVRVVVDLSEHIGKNIYIKVTDNGTTQKSHEYLHLDDFVMYKTEAEVTAAVTERNNYIKQYGRPVYVNDTPEAKTVKNGNFEDGLNNWLVVEGDAFTPRSIQPATEKFNMGGQFRHYNANGYFLNGWVNGEEKSGIIRSTTFTLGETGIISFLLGNANHNEVYVAVCNDEEIGGIAKDTELFKVSAKDAFKDNALSVNMLRRYINASSYTPDGGEAVSLLGKKLYIKFVDEWESNDFGTAAFDDVRCSMTEEEVIALEKADYKWAMELTGRGEDEIKCTQDYYTTYDYPIALPVIRFVKTATNKALKAGSTAVNIQAYIEGVEAQYGDASAEKFTYKIVKVAYKGSEITTGFDALTFDTAGVAVVTYSAECEGETLEKTFRIEVTDEQQIMNGGFETGDLTGWTVTENASSVKQDQIVGFGANGFTTAPYNKEGDYHLNGVNDNVPEGETYALRSEDFTLGGAGVISFRLGGNAATLRVYDSASGGLLAEYKNKQWNDEKNPCVEQGCRNLTMTAYYADLSNYLGMTLYIELADTVCPTWGVMFADEIITYYAGETADVLAVLASKSDTVNYIEHDYKVNDNVEHHAAGTVDIAWVEATNEITPELVQVTNKAKNVGLTGAHSNHNLTQYIENVTGVVIGVSNATINTTITKVSDGTNEYNDEDFASFNLEAGKTYTVTYTLTYSNGNDTYSTSKTFLIVVSNANEIINGGFETGDLTGWMVVEGNAFADVNVFGNTIYWGDKDYHQEGNFHLDGWQGADEPGTGIIRSSTFTLGGTGKISFRLGGGKNENVTYISVKKACDDTEVARFTNTKHTAAVGEAYMYVYVFDLTTVANDGDELYIEIVDNATGDWGLVFVDDIKTYHTAETLAALGTKDTDWFEAENKI